MNWPATRWGRAVVYAGFGNRDHLRAAVEVASDLNGDLIGLYHVLQSDLGALAGVIDSLRYTEATFDQAVSWLASDDPLEHAVGFLVRNRFSRGGLGKDFAWSNRLRGGQPGDQNAWTTFKGELPRIARRLARVELRCQDAVEVIREFDGPGTVVYADPPYVRSTRTARDTYSHEMSDTDHARLLETITRCHGMVIISGYPHPLYDEALAGGERITFDMANHAGQGRSKQRRTEVLWMNTRCGG
jgi:DNA adenine methylase